MVKVDFGYAVATVSGGQWSSDDTELVTLLESIAPLYGISGAEPDRDMALALNAIEVLGGEITEADKPESDDGVIY